MARDGWRSPRLTGRQAARQQPSDAKPSRAEALPAIRGASLIFFGGKGGVGKTTAAAADRAPAWRAPRRSGASLLLSTDPAHSLVRCARRAGGAIEPPSSGAVPETCEFAKLMRHARSRQSARELEAALDGDRVRDRPGCAGHRRGPRAPKLMNLAPPGIDELFGIVSVVDARAPTTTRSSSTPRRPDMRCGCSRLPDAAREWAQALLRVLLRLPTSGASRVSWPRSWSTVAKSIRELQALLRDGTQTRFITVTRAAETPLLETERLLRSDCGASRLSAPRWSRTR